jgi:Ca2+-binding RTX toxin-like protein
MRDLAAWPADVEDGGTTMANTAPVFTSLDDAPVFTFNGPPVVMDDDVSIHDAELAVAGGKYGGATLTLNRHGGANAQDVFGATGTLDALTQDGALVVNSTTIGTVTRNSGGTLLLTFNTSATEVLVNAAMRQLTYDNTSATTPVSAIIDWVFSDGNSGAQGTGGALTQSRSITVYQRRDGDAVGNTLPGTSALESIDGKAGNDTISGDLTGDILVGGDGDDTFELSNQAPRSIVELSNAGSGTDSISSTITRSLIFYTNVENLTLTGVADVNGTGNALANTITGNASANRLDGLAGADTMIGLDGNDTYILGDGDTVVEAAGGGNDTVGSAVTHTLAANVENLVLTGTADIDGVGNILGNKLDGTQNDKSNELTGRAGDDTYFLGADDTVIEASNGGTDLIVSGLASTTLSANVENLILRGASAGIGIGNLLGNRLDGRESTSANELRGVLGDDVYFLGAGDKAVELANAGTDLVVSAFTVTALANHVENLTLTGTGAISGTGNDLANRLDGTQNTKGNVLKGLGGDDVYFLGAGDKAVELANAGTDLVVSELTLTALANHVENLTLTGTGAISGTGNGLANRLDGTQNTKDNVLKGLGGDDVYFLGAGDKAVELSNAGTDLVVSAFTITALADNVENLTLLGTSAISGAGNGLANRIDGTQNTKANVLKGLGGDDVYLLGAGDKAVELANAGTDLVVAAVTIVALADNVENLTLVGTSAISGTGNAQANQLDGAQNSKANVLQGMAGDDRYILGAGDTVVEAAGGGDDAVFASVTHTLGANVETLVLIGTAAISGTGNSLANVLDGNQNAKANVLKGLAGNDTYFVGAGDTVVEAPGGGTSDVVRSAVSLTLGANVEHLVLTSNLDHNGTGNALGNNIVGNARNNTIDGGAGSDLLEGNAGNDTLIGGLGIDLLEGGAGGDIFVFNAALAVANRDQIADFNAAADTLRLENAVMTKLGAAGALNVSAFFAGRGPHDADDRIIYDQTSGGLFYDDDGNGAHAAVQLALLTNKPTLTAADFVVI